MQDIFYVLGSVIFGILIGYLVFKMTSRAHAVSKVDYDALQTEVSTLRIELGSRISKDELSEKYVNRETFDLIHAKLSSTEHESHSKQITIGELNAQLAEIRTREKALQEKMDCFQAEIHDLHRQSREQFKNLATEILEEKKKLFIDANKTELTNLLDPLKTDLGIFKKSIEDTRKEDIQDLTALKGEIASLHQLNLTLHEDAQNLTNALKSDVRIQGNWGEDRLNMLLEAEGLQKYIDFTTQEGYKDDEERSRRPDCILKLPDNKHLIIDSKVSLVAYVNYFSANNPVDKAHHLKLHLKSVTDHIDLLADKNYQSLAGLNTPDYVFLFMPIEPALTLALNESGDIFNRALKKKIVMTTPSTFIATLKVVKIIWQKENRVKNVEKIFEECGKLYDKFVGFMDYMERIDSGLSTAQNAFGEAMNSLKTGVRKGSTIMGRFETIRQLEARTSKQLSRKYYSEMEFDENVEEIDSTEEEDVK